MAIVLVENATVIIVSMLLKKKLVIQIRIHNAKITGASSKERIAMQGYVVEQKRPTR
jgi:hypothetical protein